MLRVTVSLKRVSSFRLFLCLLLCGVVFIGTANAQKDCARLLEELKAAQARWQEAEAAWRTAADPMTNTQRRIDDINSRLSKINGDQTRAEVELEQANSDARDCAAAAKDPKLAPLIDCSKVPARQEAAQKKVDELTAERDSLLKELKDLESRVEKLEDQNAAAHAEERKAAVALENAQQAYAKCGEFWVGRIVQRRYGGDSTQTTKTSQVQGKEQTYTESKRFSTEEVIQIDILPGPGSSDSNNQAAQVVRRYETYDYYKGTSNGTLQCRTPPPTHWEQISNQVTNERNEKGSGQAKVLFYIPPGPSGNYRVEFRFPAIDYAINTSSVRTNNNCGRSDPETITNHKSTSNLSYGSVVVQGSVNPKTPGVLKGSISNGGDPKKAFGETTVTWELRLIKAKK